MAATSSGSDSTGKKNYYNISYGMLSANAKDTPEGYEKIALSDIKSRRTKNENVDLRRRFYDTENGKTYPLRVFYTDITGTIEGVEKDKYDKGTSLKITLHDLDGDESIIQTDFYGKVAADFLNRLLNVNVESQLNFRPYSIPASFEIDGRTIDFYQAGVSIKDNGVKTERFYKGEDSGLPKTEQVQNSKGEDETSRVNQINFLWEKVETKFASLATIPQTEATDTVTPKVETPKQQVATTSATTSATSNDDLPF